jgi:hypothetical protein
VQQAISLAGSGNYVNATSLHEALPPNLQPPLTEEIATTILDSMVITDRLEPPRQGNYVLSTETEARYNRGVLHSNISDSPTTSIIDRITGDIIGTIDEADTNRIRLGSRNRKVVKSTSNRILTDRSKKAGTARFSSKGFPTISLDLARRFIESTGVLPHTVIQFPSNTNHILLHGFGIFGSTLLAAHLPTNISLIGTTPYSLRLSAPLTSLPTMTEKSATDFIHSHEPSLTRLTEPGPYHSDLPDPLRLSALKSLLNLSQFLAYYKATRLSETGLDLLSNPTSAEALG